MKVLLTGATGFLGRHALKSLTAAGVDVVATSRVRRISHGVRWAPVDLLDPDAGPALIRRERPTHLLHMAWRPVHGDVASARDNMDWLTASLGLASAFIDAGGERIVVSGSCFEYDWSNGTCDETTALVPSTYYGACKNALRAALFGMAREGNVSFAWPRIFFSYGPGENESRFVASLARALLREEPAEMTEGQQVRDFVYADDVGDALLHLVRSSHEGEFNIASGQAITLLDIATELARQIGRPGLLRPGARLAKGYEPPLIVGTTEKTAQVLGWRASTSLENGLAKTIAAMRSELSGAERASVRRSG